MVGEGGEAVLTPVSAASVSNGRWMWKQKCLFCAFSSYFFFFRRLSPRGECDSRDGEKTDEAAVAIGTCDV